MNIKEFGRRSFIGATGLIERIKKMDKEYICLTGYNRFTEDELHCCRKCGEFSCPICGGEVQAIKEYDAAMLINAGES